jgi:hypothetical protein
MKANALVALSLICVVMGCAVEEGIGNDAQNPTNDEVAEITASDSEELIVTESDTVTDDTIDDEIQSGTFDWRSVWDTETQPISKSTQSCATSTTLSSEGAVAKRCCVPTNWVATGKTAATEKVSGNYWNSRDSLGAGQQIQFKALSGKQYSRLTSSCTTEYAWVYHSSKYRLRNCSSGDSGWTVCTAWTSFKYYDSRQLKLCGSHAAPPAGSSYWGCAFGSKRWIRWE